MTKEPGLELKPAKRQLYSWGSVRKRISEPTASYAFSLLGPLLKPFFSLIAAFDWRGTANIPKHSAAIIVANHISSIDPVLIGTLIFNQGRWPHFLAKASLWKIRFLDKLLTNSGQIPVYRGSSKASESLIYAEEAIKRNQIVIIYPEGTITLDKNEWPMAIYRGAAVLAARTKAPVIPIGQWGANFILPPRKIRKINFTKRHQVTAIVGEAIDVSDLDENDPKYVDQLAFKMLEQIQQLTSQARNAIPPDKLWHPKRKCYVEVNQALQ